jgi:ankyrin repeat protein
MSQETTPAKPVYVTPTPGQRGMTMLHYAAYCNSPDSVRDQLMSGIPVDVRDDNGRTPLHWSIDMAQAWGDPDRVVSILLEHGASANSTDSSGFSVLMMACARNRKGILDRLIKAGADVHARTSASSPLHQAAGCNFHEGIAKGSPLCWLLVPTRLRLTVRAGRQSNSPRFVALKKVSPS